MSDDESSDEVGIDMRELIGKTVEDLHAGPHSYTQSLGNLKSLDRNVVIIVLRDLLNDRSARIRSNATELLVQIDGSQSIPSILPLLDDMDSNVRWNTCGILHDFGDVRAVSSLVKVLLNDSEPDIRYMAACALGRVGDSSALPALRTAKADDDGEDREGRRVSTAASDAITEILSRE